jgi:hypothetical protein
MFIVMKDGPKKGEVQEMKFGVARDLINLGRAVQYFPEEQGTPAPRPQLLTLADDVGQPAVEKSKKKRGKK